jgi:dephospho-CoA kinase
MGLSRSGAKRTVVVIVGMPGAGKSLASSAGKELKIPILVSGDVIRSEARRRKIRFSRKSLGKLMLKIRHEEGMGAVAKRLVPMIERSGHPVLIYEGARNMEEIDELRKKYYVVIVAIHASSRTRFQRLLRRRRSDRPRNWRDFLERDLRELKVGVAHTIALSDHIVENEGSKKDLGKQVRHLLEQLAC